MREDVHQRVTEFVKELYARGGIDADRFDTDMATVLAASTEQELAQVVQSLPSPITLTSPERQLSAPLEIRSGVGRLRLAGLWQLARHTHISAEIGNVTLDLSEAEFENG